MSIPFHGNVQVYVNFLIISIIQGFLNNIISKKVINRKNKIKMREVYISLKNTRKTQTNIWRIQTIERITIHWKNFKENYLNTLNKKSDIHCFVLSSQMEAAQARWLFEPVVCGFPEGRDREWQHQSWDPRRGHSRKLSPCSQAARHITIKKKCIIFS